MPNIGLDGAEGKVWLPGLLLFFTDSIEKVLTAKDTTACQSCALQLTQFSLL